MGLYNFKPQFVQPILRGDKRHTIRALRRYPDEPGDTMHLYLGLRTRSVMRLMRAPCVAIQDITVEMKLYAGTGVLARGLYFPRIFIDDCQLGRDEEQELARRDGFNDFAEMITFWRKPVDRLPFRGHIIHWDFDSRFDAMEPASEELCDVPFTSHRSRVTNHGGIPE